MGKRKPNLASSIYEGADGSWHGRVTVGVKDDGRPDRRHVRGKTEADVTRKVRDLERQREAGSVRKAGRAWSLERWLTYWLEHIATPPNVRQSTHDGYEVAVRVHLVPGIGAHRLDKLEPEHLEKLYKKMQANGSKPGTAHQAHRTLKTALNHAMRRNHITRNVAKIAQPPRIQEDEVEPYGIQDVKRLLAEAGKRRNGARWAIALALGLRQGEALGLRWEDIELDVGYLRVRRSRVRPKYAHGCEPTCGRKAGYCPSRIQTNADDDDTKSRAGRRGVGLPPEVVGLLKRHRKAQEEERATAGQLWQECGRVFTTRLGRAISPNTDYHEWKDLVRAAGVRNARLHDARHTAATVLMVIGTQQRVTMDVMGWSSADMVKRYQHVTDPVRLAVAKQVGDALWSSSADGTPTAGVTAGGRKARRRGRSRRK
ncbi:site-specific integrase [Pilimelia anulata]|uniref:Site-specific integrase n=1 Tax=Pilimelia anulata TaxID=53371 RepID=A0A8J3BH92_9ACTN|nr:tyrosine-type recombinase/integrase [Pilimelia anulata]GGK09609.1 site-specific integrase [Pilimelia anulata]